MKSISGYFKTNYFDNLETEEMEEFLEEEIYEPVFEKNLG